MDVLQKLQSTHDLPSTLEEAVSEPSELKRIAIALERIADILDTMESSMSWEYAIERWRRGEGKHPDD